MALANRNGEVTERERAAAQRGVCAGGRRAGVIGPGKGDRTQIDARDRRHLRQGRTRRRARHERLERNLGAGLRLGAQAAGRFLAVVGRGDGAARALGALRRFLARTVDALAAQQRDDLGPGERLVLQQRAGDRVKIVDVLVQDAAGARLGLIDQTANLVVDEPGRRLGDVLALGHRMAEEDLLLVVRITQRSELAAHAPLGHHPAREIGRPA